MALFTSKADADLPILTQFYQAEGPEEMEALMRRTAPYQYYLYGEPATKGYLEYEKRMVKNDLETIFPVQEIIKSMMFSFSTGLKIKREELMLIVDKYNGISKITPAIYYDNPEDNIRYRNIEHYKENSIEPNQLVVFPGFFKSKLEEIVICEFIDRLKQSRNPFEEHREKPFFLCSECNSAFVPQKDEQAYCSQRCRSRVGERRRYALRMEDYPSRYKKRG